MENREDFCVEINENTIIDISFLKILYGKYFKISDKFHNIMKCRAIQVKKNQLAFRNYELDEIIRLEYKNFLEKEYNKKISKTNLNFTNSILIDKSYNPKYREIITCQFHLRSIRNLDELNNYQKMNYLKNNKLDNDFFIFNTNSFYQRFPEFDFNFYKNKYNLKEDKKNTILHYLTDGIKNRYLYSDKYFFVFYTPLLDYNCGGIVAIHNLVKLINQQNNINYKAKIFNIENIKYTSEFCSPNDFITKEEINDNCIIIYPEIIKDNPLNSKNVIRWILLEMGIESGLETITSWKETDLICNWESDDKSSILRYHYINKIFKKEENCKRNLKICLIKKGRLIHNMNEQRELLKTSDFLLDDIVGKQHHKYFDILTEQNFTKDELEYIKNLINNEGEESQIEKIICFFFNRCEIFYTFDPKTMWIVYALKCGCPVVIIPFKGLNKEDYFKQSIFNIGTEILNTGVAWGEDEIEFAKNTIKEARVNIDYIFSNEKLKVLNKINSIYDRFLSVNQNEKLDRELEKYLYQKTKFNLNKKKNLNLKFDEEFFKLDSEVTVNSMKNDILIEKMNTEKLIKENKLMMEEDINRANNINLNSENILGFFEDFTKFICKNLFIKSLY